MPVLFSLTQIEIAFQQTYMSIKEHNFELTLKPLNALYGLLENNVYLRELKTIP